MQSILGQLDDSGRVVHPRIPSHRWQLNIDAQLKTMMAPTVSEAVQAVSDKLNGHYMETGVIQLVQSAFPAQKKHWVWKVDADALGSQMLVAPTPRTSHHPIPFSAAHGEILVRSGLRIPIVVLPVGASIQQLHRLSEAVQAFARHRAAEHLGIRLCFIAVRRDDTVDPIEPARWNVSAVRFK